MFDAELATLDVVKAQLGITSTDEADDILIRDLITAATGLMQQYCGRSFVPSRETRRFDAYGDHIDTRQLILDADLLAVHTLTNGDGTVITSGQYKLRPSNIYPKIGIELLPSAGVAFTWSTDWQEAISIDGTWGYHEDWANAWADTTENVPTGGMTNSATSFTAADADGKDARYRTRFQKGMLLKIEDEMLKVVDVNATTNAVTVLRGQRGTTAASHTAGLDIFSFAPMRNLEQCCIGLTVYLYRNKETVGDKLQFMDGNILLSNDVPKNIAQTLDRYLRIRGVAL